MTAGTKEQIHHAEREFHDQWAATIDPASVDVRAFFEAETSPEPRWLLEQLGELKGRRVLDLGTGAGEAAVYFALLGADVTATDLSPGMLEVTSRVAAHHGVSLVTTVASAEDLSMFPSESFDVVYGANVLHHVDIDKCLDEVRRVLKPGGCGAFWDPIAHNPAINVYRRMAMEVRTEDEHPIRRGDMRRFRSRFSTIRSRTFWLLSLLIFVKFYLIDRVHPNQDRYWKRIITRERELRPWYRPLAALDRVILFVCPPLRWWCWNLAVIAKK